MCIAPMSPYAALYLLYVPQGQRQRKLHARKQREEKEETERLQIDIEEAKYQASQRREAIDKAKTQQYYQTDRVKAFHVSRCFIILKNGSRTQNHTLVFVLIQCTIKLGHFILPVPSKLPCNLVEQTLQQN